MPQATKKTGERHNFFPSLNLEPLIQSMPVVIQLQLCSSGSGILYQHNHLALMKREQQNVKIKLIQYTFLLILFGF